MLIQLAYPYDGHEPDDTIEVDDQTGRTLVRDGVARLPGVNDHRSVAELRQLAADRGVDLGGATRKADIVAALDAAGGLTVTPSSTTPAPAGNTEEA